MQDLVPTQHQQQHHPVPFGQGRGLAQTGAINQGAVTVEVERAIAEAQGQMALAKRFPRDLTAAHAELMLACKSPAFAGVAFYSKPQGGSTVTGPSIRMAEQIAQVYGNFQYGHRELSRDDSKSEVEVFAWDMEKNNYVKRQLTVLHVRDTREGPKKLRDQTDIDMKINNVASKQSRGLILAMMPKWLVEEAVQDCRKTIAGNNEEPLEVRVRKMTQAFAKFGVKPQHLEKYLGHTLDEVLLDELVDLQGVYNSLRDGTPASDIFGDHDDESPQAESTSKGIAETAKAGAAAKAAADKTKPAAKAGTVAQKQGAAEPAPDSNPVKSESKAVEEQATPAATPAENSQAQTEGADSVPDRTKDGADLF
jgi:hypothetical protein